MSIFCSFKICFQPNSDVGMQEMYSVMFISKLLVRLDDIQVRFTYVNHIKTICT
jgi:hypothetical protein